MYFVHPQLKFNLTNLLNLFFCFLKKSKEEELLKNIKEMFPEREIYFTDMGRSAFRLIIEKFNLQNSEILFPAFICDIFYPLFKKYNLSPVFLDINLKTFNIKPEEIEKKITKKTKAILVCHTYGFPADLRKILPLAKKYNLLVIEDCTHSFGAKYDGKFLGNFGEASFFSLYKLFPTLRGGMAVIKTQKSKVKNQKSSFQGSPFRWKRNGTVVKSQNYLKETHFSFRDFLSLLNCFSFFSFLFKKYGAKIAPKYVREEKLSEIGGLNRVSLNIFSWQMRNFEKILEKRRELGLIFQEELKKLGFEVQESKNNIFTFLSAQVPKNIDRDKFVIGLRKKGVFLTRIWKDPIILNPEVQKEYDINPEEFPETLQAAKRIVNFPLQNFYTKKEIKNLIEKIKTAIRR